jgi:hypothetical protein
MIGRACSAPPRPHHPLVIAAAPSLPIFLSVAKMCCCSLRPYDMCSGSSCALPFFCFVVSSVALPLPLADLCLQQLFLVVLPWCYLC